METNYTEQPETQDKTNKGPSTLQKIITAFEVGALFFSPMILPSCSTPVKPETAADRAGIFVEYQGKLEKDLKNFKTEIYNILKDNTISVEDQKKLMNLQKLYSNAFNLEEKDAEKKSILHGEFQKVLDALAPVNELIEQEGINVEYVLKLKKGNIIGYTPNQDLKLRDNLKFKDKDKETALTFFKGEVEKATTLNTLVKAAVDIDERKEFLESTPEERKEQLKKFYFDGFSKEEQTSIREGRLITLAEWEEDNKANKYPYEVIGADGKSLSETLTVLDIYLLPVLTDIVLQTPEEMKEKTVSKNVEAINKLVTAYGLELGLVKPEAKKEEKKDEKKEVESEKTEAPEDITKRNGSDADKNKITETQPSKPSAKDVLVNYLGIDEVKDFYVATQTLIGNDENSVAITIDGVSNRKVIDALEINYDSLKKLVESDDTYLRNAKVKALYEEMKNVHEDINDGNENLELETVNKYVKLHESLTSTINSK